MTPLRLSANTGYLFRDLPFVERIRAAAAHGFDGVEFHDEAQRADRTALKDTLAETGLPVLGLNVRMGDSFGCAAIPGMADQARRDIDVAAELAGRIGARAIHVLGGITDHADARVTYVANLRHALDVWSGTVLIEPVSASQVPGFFLRDIEVAARLQDEIGHDRLKIMFDCFHIHAESGDVAGRFTDHAARIGHVQISAVEDRAEPFPGRLDYARLIPLMQAAGYRGWFGCEYRPKGRTAEGLGWRDLI